MDSFIITSTPEAKRGYGSLLGLGTDDGVTVVLDYTTDDPEKRGEYIPHVYLVSHILIWGHKVINHYSHTNESVIHDIRWSVGDSYIACAGGDGITSVHDVERVRITAELSGHLGSVKCVDWSTSMPGVLYTGGRDGDVIIWDVRCPGNRQLALRMSEAHLAWTRPPVAQTDSVTSLIQRDTGQRELVTSNCKDG